MKFAAFGRTQWLFDAVVAAAARGHVPVLIGTARPSPEYTVTERDFERLADRLGCEYFTSQNMNRPEVTERLSRCAADVAISMNWPGILSRSFLERFPQGVINAHPGDLPRFRGNAAPNWAILTGESAVVVTLHRMAEALDSGPVLLQRSMPIDEGTYIGDAYAFIAKHVPEMFAEVLDGLQANTLVERPQSEAQARRCLPRLPIDSEIRWADSARNIAALIRASAEPFPGAYTFLDGQRLAIWRAHVAPSPFDFLGAPGQVADRLPTGHVTVACGAGLLIVEEVELDSQGRQPAARVLTSSRMRLGAQSADIARLRAEVRALSDRLRGDRHS